jgi:hypothetical protein
MPVSYLPPQALVQDVVAWAGSGIDVVAGKINFGMNFIRFLEIDLHWTTVCSCPNTACHAAETNKTKQKHPTPQISIVPLPSLHPPVLTHSNSS